MSLVSVDGLDLHPLPTNNLTLPLTAIATGPGRPLLVTDQNGLWSFGADDLGSWRQLVGSVTSVAGSGAPTGEPVSNNTYRFEVPGGFQEGYVSFETSDGVEQVDHF